MGLRPRRVWPSKVSPSQRVASMESSESALAPGVRGVVDATELKIFKLLTLSAKVEEDGRLGPDPLGGI